MPGLMPRKRTMENLNLYAEIIRATQALIIVLDTEGRIVMFNPACERVSGYRFEEVEGRPLLDFLLIPEERDAVRAVFEDLRCGHFPNRFGNYWVTKSGGRRWIEWSNSAICDASGRVTQIIGTGIDVTDSHDVERQLRDSQGQFQEVANALPLVFWIMNPHNNLVSYVSPGFEIIWGRSLPDPATAFEVFRTSIHPDDREAMFRKLQHQAADAELGGSEYRIVRPDGEVRWVHSRVFPIRDEHGGLRRIVGYAEDITEHKLAAQRLQEIQQRQKALLDSIPDAAWLIDADEKYVEINRNYAKHLGIDLPHIIGKKVTEIIPAPMAAENAAENREIMGTGKPLRVERHRVIGGEDYWVDIIKTPVTDATGKVIGIAGIARDITARKLAEERRRARDDALRATLVM